jgi:class 3 adenylate cyclase
MPRYVPLTRKVNSLIVASLIVCIGFVVAYLAYSRYSAQLSSIDKSLQQQSLIIYYAIKNLMLPGDAPIAVSYVSDIENAGLNYTVSLYRTSGVEAFYDNETIGKVNANIAQMGGKRFPLRTVKEEPETIDPNAMPFRRAVVEGQDSLFQEVHQGRTVRTLFAPLINLPKCSLCHGADHTIRGVLQLTADITEEVLMPRRALGLAGAFFVALVALLTVILTQFLRRSVIQPVRRIGEVCAYVTQGHFDRKVELAKNDEIGRLAETVNQMVDGLHERFQLSKFVSNTTLRSLRGGEQGKKVELAILFSDVRGFTSFTERQAPETVVTYLNRLLALQTEIIHKYGGDVDKYVGDAVVALFSGEGKELRACASAVEIQEEMARGRSSRYGGLSLGIGIDTGGVILGMIGSQARADFTVIGDHVNNTSRLCAIARAGMTLLSEGAYRAVSAKVRARGPLIARVKGKQNEQKVYALESVMEVVRWESS